MSFQLSLRALCMAHYSTTEMPMPHRKETAAAQLRLTQLHHPCSFAHHTQPSKELL